MKFLFRNAKPSLGDYLALTGFAVVYLCAFSFLFLNA
jgi:hypothetical protein